MAIFGDKGSGKTNSMVEMLFEKYRHGRNIYSNIELKFPKIKGSGKIFPFIFKDFIEQFKNPDFKLNNCVVVLDEIHVFVDSRRSMSKDNIMFNRFVTQSRHRSVDIFYTTQDINISCFMRGGQVDIRTRKLTDRIFYCETITKFKDGHCEKNTENWIDPVKDKMMCCNWIYNTAGILIGKRMFHANPIFKLYDSDEIVDAFA